MLPAMTVPLPVINCPPDASPGGRTKRRRFPSFGSTLLAVVGLATLPCLAQQQLLVAPAPFHPQRILVQPRRDADLTALNQFHAAQRCRTERAFPTLGRLQVVRLADGADVPTAVARYQASGLVQFAEPDYVVTAAATFPNDPRMQDGTQWGLNNYGQNGGLPDADLDAPEAWDVQRSASNIIVAIVDSGVRYTHEDLTGNLWQNPRDGTYGFNALTGAANPWDDFGHGTHLAGIMGAMTDNAKGIAGVAWHLQIMACKFLDATGNGFNSDAVACLEFARTNGARILNLSWGGASFSAAISNALWQARADGIIVVAAAGNDARDIDVTPFYPASIALDNIVAVGAATRTDAIWNLSNYGATSVDLFAPGAAIYSTGSASDNAYLSRDGSSMAAAWVTGGLALMLEQAPQASVSEHIGRLLAAVDRPPALAGKCVTGGRFNLRKALDWPTLTATPGVWPFQAQVGGIAGHSYVLTASTNLATWTALQTNLMPSGGGWNFTDAQSTNLPARFYRAIPGP